MRCKVLLNSVLSTAALALFASSVIAADEVRQPNATASSGEMRLKDSPIGVKDKGAVKAPLTTSSKSKTAASTSAKRMLIAAPLDTSASKIQAVSTGDSPAVEPVAKNAEPVVKKSPAKLVTPKELPPAEVATIEAEPESEPAEEAASQPEQVAEQPKKKTTDESLQPTPDSLESGPISLEAASFKGVTPGTSTLADVEKVWGAPKEAARQGDTTVHLFSVQPFNRVEVSYTGEKVSSVVIRLDRAFPAPLVAKQLDLTTVQPVLVSNELGEVLGLAYPERGVLFAFEAGKEPTKPSMKVSQIILETITAEPFVLRAETTIENRFDLSRRDLETALSLESDNARAHWLYSRVLLAMDEQDKAIAEATEAVQYEPDNAKFRVTRAQILAQAGRLPEALEDVQKAIAMSEKRLHVTAQALCLLGDLLASGPKPDYKKALASHTQALQLADTLAADEHPAIRLAAKQVLIDSHLGAAHDIAWGDWKEKDKAVARWLDRALAVATDMAKNDGNGQEQVFRVHARAMAVYVGIRGGVDPAPTAKAIVRVGNELIDATSDPVHKAKLQWDLGMALYDAVQICQIRSEYDTALKLGEQSAEYLAKANEAKQSTTSAFMLGRLYFRLGTIHALRDQDHEGAVSWFDKALSLLERPSDEELADDLGRHGEAFVSMGVSYWETDQREKAVTLTERGIKWMEQAVRRGMLDRSSLSIPYSNLAAMHRTLGSTSKADRFQAMAAKAKKETVK